MDAHHANGIARQPHCVLGNLVTCMITACAVGYIALNWPTQSLALGACLLGSALASEQLNSQALLSADLHASDREPHPLPTVADFHDIDGAVFHVMMGNLTVYICCGTSSRQPAYGL